MRIYRTWPDLPVLLSYPNNMHPKRVHLRKHAGAWYLGIQWKGLWRTWVLFVR